MADLLRPLRVLDAISVPRPSGRGRPRKRRQGLQLPALPAAARAVGALAFAGAKRPAVVSQPLSQQRVSTISGGANITDVLFPVTRERLEGYRQAAEAAGIAWRDVVIAVCARNDAAEAERIAATLLASAEPPDAIAAMRDEQAAGVVHAARAAGRVIPIPDDVAVTGWDDAAVAAQLGLTTVAQSLRGQGAACAQAALGQKPNSHTASWSIVRRGSTRL
jgi:DNA-binding LacI/PurR family transcriptional regulator